LSCFCVSIEWTKLEVNIYKNKSRHYEHIYFIIKLYENKGWMNSINGCIFFVWVYTIDNTSILIIWTITYGPYVNFSWAICLIKVLWQFPPVEKYIRNNSKTE
jgi:hypothetical protein